MALSSIFESSSGQQRWIKQISKILEKEVKVEIDVPVSIFRVSATLSVYKPEAYTPQIVALGPYHHFRPELYEMERYKLAAASRLQKQFKTLEFKQLVDSLTEMDNELRASYHKYLDIDTETLAWIMAIDGLFLLEFLGAYIQMVKESLASNSVATAHLVDSAGRKIVSHAILGDILMLENQLPLFLLGKILFIQSAKPELGTDLLPSMLIDFCKSLSPLKLIDDFPISKVSECSHLLDLLYQLTVPKSDSSEQPHYGYSKSEAKRYAAAKRMDSGNSQSGNQVFTKLWNLLSDLNVGILGKIMSPVKKIFTLVGNMATSVPGMSSLRLSNRGITKADDEDTEECKVPIVEEIMIPSVEKLIGAGVEFRPSLGGVTTIEYNTTTKIFFLPPITLNTNSEVIMRNLVAYEASTVSETLVLARYHELMNGIIDTPEDAKLLRERKIIKNSLKSDEDVAELFNGMSKAVRLTNVPYIDKAIEDVNKYYDNTMKVKLIRRMKIFLKGSWLVLTVLAVILLLLLMGLQSFCSVYSCPKIFGTATT